MEMARERHSTAQGHSRWVRLQKPGTETLCTWISGTRLVKPVTLVSTGARTFFEGCIWAAAAGLETGPAICKRPSWVGRATFGRSSYAGTRRSFWNDLPRFADSDGTLPFVRLPVADDRDGNLGPLMRTRRAYVADGGAIPR